MAEAKPQRAMNPRVGSTLGGGVLGASMAQMIVELANKMGANLSGEFQESLGLVLIIALGGIAGWMTRDRDE